MNSQRQDPDEREPHSLPDESHEAELASLVEQYEQLLDAMCAPSPEEFAAAHPAYQSALRETLPLIVRLRKAAIATQAETHVSPAAESIRELGQLRSGDRVHQFRILSELGRGGMGIVFRVQDEDLNREAALKVINPSVLNAGQSADDEVARFAAEARSMAALDHPNLIRVNGVHRWKNTWCFDMELFHGTPLVTLLRHMAHRARNAVTLPANELAVEVTNTLLSQPDNESGTPAGKGLSRVAESIPKSGTDSAETDFASDHAQVSDHATTLLLNSDSRGQRLKPAEFYDRVATIGIRIADAMSYAHRQGLIHRDIKPANLMVGPSLSVKLLDFGLATSSDRAFSTADSAGSLRYMAPERFLSGPQPQSDVYAIGVTLLEILAAAEGILPEETLEESTPAPRGFQPRKPISELLQDCPKDLAGIITCATARRISERYQSADELQRDLLCFTERRPVSAVRWPPAKQVRYFVRNHRTPAILLFSLTLSLVVTLVAWFVTRTALSESTLANSRAAEFLSELQVTNRENALSRIRFSQQLIDHGFRDQGLYEISQLPDDYRSWDTRWLERAATTSLVPVLSIANGDWAVLDAAISQDGQRLASCTAGGQLCVWNLETGLLEHQIFSGRLMTSEEQIPHVAHYFEDRPSGSSVMDWTDTCVISLAWSETNELVCLTLKGELLTFAWDYQIRTTRRLSETNSPLHFGLISQDARHFVVGLESGRIRIGEREKETLIELQPGEADGAQSDLLTAACFNPTGREWCLGFHSGRILCCSETGQHLAETQLDGPIWSLDTHQASPELRIVAGAESDEISLLTRSSPATLTTLSRISLSGGPLKPNAVHLVRFNPLAPEEVIAVDSLHRVIRTNFRQQNAMDVEFNVERETRFLRRANRQRLTRSPDELPPLFRRRATVCEVFTRPESANRRSLMFGGQNNELLICEDRRRDSAELSRRILKTTSGARPELHCLSERPDAFAVLSDRRRVQLISPERDAIVSELDLNDFRPLTMVAGLYNSEPHVAVACADQVIRFFCLTETQWQHTESLDIVANAELLHIKADQTLKTVAGVTTNGTLLVWSRLADGSVSTQTFAPENGDPMQGTGDLAVSPDGEWVVAGSSGQIVISLHRRSRSQPYEAFRSHLEVAGDGVESITLNPRVERRSVVCFAADSLLRVRTAEFLNDANPLKLPMPAPELLESPCRRLLPTNDFRRVVLLQRNGLILFLSPEQATLVSSLRSSLKDCRDLVFTEDGRWMIVASEDGRIEAFDTQPAARSESRAPEVPDEMTVPWTTRSWDFPIPIKDRRPGSDLQSLFAVPVLHVRQDGEWACVVPVNAPNSPAHFLGSSLLFDSLGHTAIPLQTDEQTAFVDRRALAVQISPDNRTCVTWRTITASDSLQDAYTGDLWYGEVRNNRIQSECIDRNSNCGFSAYLSFDDQSRPTLVHLSYGPAHGRLDVRDAPGTWRHIVTGYAGFHPHGAMFLPESGEWLIAGNCDRRNANVPSRLITVNDKGVTTFQTIPFRMIPHRLYPHGADSTILCEEISHDLSVKRTIQKAARQLTMGTTLQDGDLGISDCLALGPEQFALIVTNREMQPQLILQKKNRTHHIPLPRPVPRTEVIVPRLFRAGPDRLGFASASLVEHDHKPALRIEVSEMDVPGL